MNPGKGLVVMIQAFVSRCLGDGRRRLEASSTRDGREGRDMLLMKCEMFGSEKRLQLLKVFVCLCICVSPRGHAGSRRDESSSHHAAVEQCEIRAVAL
ncbi:unnamed protein product [Pleuronectes platessa]|uniref:Uncharacterized protein n=1 Tax=Pleuronectes platessa TaxID=8262 RepID=A0A9N7TPK0_PLEPL|nr:unnamed protein product [Pleuronectes platessa]